MLGDEEWGAWGRGVGCLGTRGAMCGHMVLHGLQSFILHLSLLQTAAVGEAGETLEGEWWGEEKILKLTDTRAGDKCEACGELSLADVDDYLVQGETLRLVDGDCPRQLEGQLES